jgi:thiol-disulfide isomerase/thioredoxin
MSVGPAEYTVAQSGVSIIVIPRRILLFPLAAALCVPALGAETGAGSVHALLINGGDRPESNYLSHLHHLQDMVDVLRRRGVAPERIHVFSADGGDPAEDLTTREVAPPDFWILEGTGLGSRLRPPVRLVDTRWAGVTLHPARQADLRDWFERARQTLAPGDRLLLFVTDHGTQDAADPENNAISLWREKLTVKELRELLARLAPGVQVVMVMSQCYSGAFAGAAGSPSADPSGDVCGFFSTTARQMAYGCYPEGRDKDQIGHAFQFIEAFGHKDTAAEAHLEVLAGDDTPDAPLRTTDAYLERVVGGAAAARGQEVPALVDSLLAEAWRDRAAWEPEIRLLDRIGSAFGTFSPRSLGEIAAREEELTGLARTMATYADTWRTALVGVQDTALRQFVREQAAWQERLEAGAVARLSAAERAKLLDELLPALLAHVRGQKERWAKLDDFRGRAKRGAEARWRLEVRRAALQRMRTVLVGIAGRVLVARDEKQHRALSGLQRCESVALGELPEGAARAPAVTPSPFPPLRAEIATLEELSPSWLGVRFRPVTENVRTQRALPDGATLLDAVYPDSPAQEAGLRVGDVLLGPPGSAFQTSRELREWTLVAPRGVALPMAVLRPGETPETATRFEASLVLRVVPVTWPKLPDPPQVGERAPSLPAGLQAVGPTVLSDLKGRPHALFFWATWCGPCKRAVPEVLALSESRRLPVLAISDEDADTVREFLADRKEAFLSEVAVDPLRQSFQAFGVSGTPTLLLLDAEGTIRHRQVGYTPEKGLTVEGWKWPAR